MKYLDQTPSDIGDDLFQDLRKVQEGIMKPEDFIHEIVATLEVYRARLPKAFNCTHCYRMFYSQRGLDMHKEKVLEYQK